MFVLVVNEKGGSQQRLQFDKDTVTVGRIHGNDVVLPRGNVSKHHSKIDIKEGVFTITDMGSTNGTYVNGRRVPETQPIIAGDKIYVGDFILHIDADVSPTIPEESFHAMQPLSEERPSNDSSKPVVISEKSEIAPPPPLPPRKSRQSVPPPPSSRASAGPKERRVPLPKPTVRGEDDTTSSPPLSKVKPTSADQAPEPPGDEVLATVEKIFQQISRKVQLIGLSGAPTMVEPRTAGQIRAEIYAVVDNKHERGEIPFPLTPEMLKGMVFRQAVYLGPLSEWLTDPSVDKIRIFGPNSISLLRGGVWVDAVRGFMSREELSQIVLCLASGLKAEEAGPSGTRRFRLEEGHCVYTALTHGTLFVTIDKTATRKSASGSDDPFVEADHTALEDAVGAGMRIAIVGRSSTARKQVFHRILSTLPPGTFVVTLEDLPLDLPLAAKCLRLPIQRSAEGEGRFRASLFHAISLEPVWLGVCGTNWREMPDLLCATAGRGAVIADLPLGARDALDREFGVVMTCAGVPLTRSAAVSLLHASFDVIIDVGRSETEGVIVNRIVAPALNDLGEWAPRVISGRDHPEFPT